MMEMLSHKSITAAMASGGNNGTENVNSNAIGLANAEQLFPRVFEQFSNWQIGGNMTNNESQNNTPPNNTNMFNNFFTPFDAPNEFIMSAAPITISMTAPKMSPASSNKLTLNCSYCEYNPSMRCLDCNEFMCNDCLKEHLNTPSSSNHAIAPFPTPIGTSPTSSTSASAPKIPCPKYICDEHNELLGFVCEQCKKLVCQFCTLHEHKEHYYKPIQKFVGESKQNIANALENSRTGTRCIKVSIDKALAFIRLIEKNCADVSDNIRKAFRQFIIAIEDRERMLLDFVDKLRQRRLSTLHEQMAGLKSALAGLAETTDMLHKLSAKGIRMDQVDIALKITNGQRQLEQFSAIYNDLQPKQEAYAFVPPNYTLIKELRNQGGVILLNDKNVPIMNITGGIILGENASVDSACMVSSIGGNIPANGVVATNMRRALLRDNSFRNPSPVMQNRGGSACSMLNPGLDWELSLVRSSPGLHFGTPRSTPAIPGTSEPVKARRSNALSLSFATEGHEDGQVSRPWGLYVDKLGHILVSDRRNNRVQVFNPDGGLKFKFGHKGVGNGEFDLPAGICVDIDNRIIVVDKDNHRVQIFTSTGAFLLKFGSYGKEYGQFQYPWDVAVNSRRQIVVTDSRNHRIQQFDSEGRFIRQIVFDNHGSTKGIASPRGVCYAPNGNIIVSDFDNHCLYLIDPDINEILSAKGNEGSALNEFNRPSGICCDDEGRIIVADSKNQRILVYSPTLDYLWDIEIRPSLNSLMPDSLDEKDRTCDVALMPDGRIVFLIELSPDSKEGSNRSKHFVHVF